MLKYPKEYIRHIVDELSSHCKLSILMLVMSSFEGNYISPLSTFTQGNINTGYLWVCI